MQPVTLPKERKRKKERGTHNSKAVVIGKGEVIKPISTLTHHGQNNMNMYVHVGVFLIKFYMWFCSNCKNYTFHVGESCP